MTDPSHTPIHPGELLREEFLAPLGLSPAQLAAATGADAAALAAVLAEQAPITAEIGLRLARAFGQDELYWPNAQLRYDVECVAHLPGIREIPVLAQCRVDGGAD